MHIVKDLEEDPSTLQFLEELGGLDKLEIFHFALHDLRIEFSSIFINIVRRLESLKELSVIMGLRQFDFKDAEKYSILDFGFWCRRLSKVFSQLRTISMEFPCIYVEEIDPQIDVLKNIQVISLGYRLITKPKSSSKVKLIPWNA